MGISQLFGLDFVIMRNSIVLLLLRVGKVQSSLWLRMQYISDGIIIGQTNVYYVFCHICLTFHVYCLFNASPLSYNLYMQPYKDMSINQMINCLIIHKNPLTCTTNRFLIMEVVGKGIISCFTNFTLEFFSRMAVK